MVLPRPNDRTFSTCQVHFIPIKDVWHTLLIQSGHKYSTPPPTLCNVTACVFHIRLLVTLLVGDDSNLLWNFFNMPRLHSSRRHCFFHTHILILWITHQLQFAQGRRYFKAPIAATNASLGKEIWSNPYLGTYNKYLLFQAILMNLLCLGCNPSLAN